VTVAAAKNCGMPDLRDMEISRQPYPYTSNARCRMRSTNSLFARSYPSRSLPNLLASSRLRSAYTFASAACVRRQFRNAILAFVFLTARRAYIQMMVNVAGCRPKDLTSADTPKSPRSSYSKSANFRIAVGSSVGDLRSTSMSIMGLAASPGTAMSAVSSSF